MAQYLKKWQLFKWPLVLAVATRSHSFSPPGIVTSQGRAAGRERITWRRLCICVCRAAPWSCTQESEPKGTVSKKERKEPIELSNETGENHHEDEEEEDQEQDEENEAEENENQKKMLNSIWPGVCLDQVKVVVVKKKKIKKKT